MFIAPLCREPDRARDLERLGDRRADGSVVIRTASKGIDRREPAISRSSVKAALLAVDHDGEPHARIAPQQRTRLGERPTAAELGTLNHQLTVWGGGFQLSLLHLGIGPPAGTVPPGVSSAIA